MYTGTRSWIRVLACASAGVAAALSWSQSLIWLGTLGGDYSAATAVSADGKVVVGVAKNTAGQERAFRWTESDEMQDLGTLPGYTSSEASGISADGKIVVGTAKNVLDQRRAFRWTAAEGMQDLGRLYGYEYSAATAISADGLVVVGVASREGQARAFRWTVGSGMQDIGALPGGKISRALGVSADGRIVVGAAKNRSGRFRAFRWIEAGRMQDLGTLPDPQPRATAPRPRGLLWRIPRRQEMEASEATAVSADGKVVVGNASKLGGIIGRAFRWTEKGKMQDLGLLGNDSTFALAVSADGAIVVGKAVRITDGHQRAFRWTAENGMENLNITYASLLKDGSRLEVARAISPDGRYIVGVGYNAITRRQEAFLLDTGKAR